jgi:hypothetical protein
VTDWVNRPESVFPNPVTLIVVTVFLFWNAFEKKKKRGCKAIKE